ncbi:MAG: S-methyl-5'-thioadenosine phosphorylase [Spirochaetia bacterium]|nr:S-methyl-5'-thioadenosine phosphorylase [Spirochaetia bacterium]
MREQKAELGIIGGTGLYEIPGINVKEKVFIDTPWGKPSDEIILAEYETDVRPVSIAFLPRHGRGHFLSPSEIPHKANLAALKMLGVDQIVSFSSVGSLKEEIPPGDFALPGQIFDRTRHRDDTYYGEGVVVHVSFGDPFCGRIADSLEACLKKTGIKHHVDETVVCMEGPAFSTRAESIFYQNQIGAGLINMTVLPEAKLARELEICYQMVCMSTDYDSWRESHEAITVEEILKIVKDNSEKATKLLKTFIPEFAKMSERDCSCKNAVKYSIITAETSRPQATREKLNKVLPGYF